MKTVLKISKIINITALYFLAFGFYGLPITGALQVIAAFLFLLIFPKDKLIFLYFMLVGLFFWLWDKNITPFNWLLIIPPYLIIHLSYTIHTKKI